MTDTETPCDSRAVYVTSGVHRRGIRANVIFFFYSGSERYKTARSFLSTLIPRKYVVVGSFTTSFAIRASNSRFLVDLVKTSRTLFIRFHGDRKQRDAR